MLSFFLLLEILNPNSHTKRFIKISMAKSFNEKHELRIGYPNQINVIIPASLILNLTGSHIQYTCCKKKEEGEKDEKKT